MKDFPLINKIVINIFLLWFAIYILRSIFHSLKTGRFSNIRLEVNRNKNPFKYWLVIITQSVFVIALLIMAIFWIFA